MIKTYTYEVRGTAARGQTWTTTGTVTADFATVFHEVIKDTFASLTGGRAVFGLPGVGCNGPYQVDFVQISVVVQ